MNLIQFLDCNELVSSCCSDYGLVVILNVVRKFLNIFQILIPIILIVSSTIQFTKMVINPDEKGAMKKVYNMFFAAVICFFLPIVIDAFLGLVPNSFAISSCWEEAKNYSEKLEPNNETFDNVFSSGVDTSNNKKSLVVDFVGNGKSNNNGNISNGNYSSSCPKMGIDIANYANKFVGQPYKYGGKWNGEIPYTPTDCSGFVYGVFRHFKISIPDYSYGQMMATHLYDVVSPDNICPGDVVIYNRKDGYGHTGILTGNGMEIIHAKCTNCGVVREPNYVKASSHSVMKLVRFKGVK